MSWGYRNGGHRKPDAARSDCVHLCRVRSSRYHMPGRLLVLRRAVRSAPAEQFLFVVFKDVFPACIAAGFVV